MKILMSFGAGMCLAAGVNMLTSRDFLGASMAFLASLFWLFQACIRNEPDDPEDDIQPDLPAPHA